ncbi:DMT family transporter [Clostridium folliculivorans]|uniref:Membrane protein n=1 Tax=Clostridium folliculivorans TaxID=2886038 RepID=A0A9W6D9W9_9CLOT|nr:EamA family transporter [Clostridium folliculivorans]GKU24569.1 membrane protein [Clostridium folliculivorans]GKU30667.1 membrane protein [Clostridium folliculivorans]
MNKAKVFPIVQSLLAALLFGASAPLAKILLGQIDPIPLAAFLYLGSGTGLLIYQIVLNLISKDKKSEAPLSKKELPWLLGAITFGGVIAPIILMTSLKVTPASTAALLLNFEGVATTLIALFFFKESIGKRVWIAVICITIASIALSWDFSNQWGFSLGALGVVGACVCWGIDNNFTRNISAKNPYTIVILKGFGAGLFSLFLTFLLKYHIPQLKVVLLAMILGCFSYGLSIVLFVFAMRNLGSARTSAFFGTAPFIGVILAFLFNHDIPNAMFYVALPVMILGTFFLLKEDHNHKHTHEHILHEHRHCHNDEHHNHIHLPGEVPESGYHSHAHEHEELKHEHPHVPDIHHRHIH